MSRVQPCRTVGLLVPNLGGLYFSPIILSAYETARRHDARLVVIKESPRGLAQSRLAWDHVDGWIVVRDTDGVELMTEAGAVIVTLSTRVAGIPAVLPDNHGGMQAAVAHLIAHGHRRIAFLGNLENTDIAQRFAGYRATMASHGLPFDEHLVVLTEGELSQDGAQATRRLLAAGVDFTAIVAATDMNALGVIEVLQAAGRQLPEDCAIVGFDDILMAQTTEPPLTTVQQHFPQIASLAVERLLAQLADPSLPPDPIYAPTALVVRRSCGCSAGQMQIPLERAGARGTAVAREALARQLLQHLAPLQSWELPRDQNQFRASLAMFLETIERAIANRALPGAAELKDTWREIMALGTDVQALNGIATAVEQVGLHLLGAQPLDDPAVARVIDAMRHIRGALLQAHVAREHDRIHHFDRMLYTNNNVSVAMLDTWTTSTVSLEWLQHTPVAWGCLGLWTDPATQSELVLASSYLRDVPTSPGLDGPVAPAAFPPIAQLTAATPADDELITLVPLQTTRRVWGVLALNAVIDFSLTWYSDPVVIWSRLLSAVLERVALLNDLEVQRRGLLEMYKREQLLTATLRTSEERYALAAAGTNDGLWDWDLTTDRVYYSPRWKALLGYAEGQIGDSYHDWFGRVHPDDLHILQRVIAQHHASQNTHFEIELRMQHCDGGERWMLCRGTTVYDEQGAPQRMAGSISDISQRKHFEEQLRHSAFHDALTGLPNRSLLLDRLEQAIQRVRHVPGHLFALLFLDLDRFKTVNDSLGHLTGDLLLIRVARRLQTVVRRSDTVARLGGDEFVILLDDITDGGDVAGPVHQIEKALHLPFNLNGHEVFTSASIGILTEVGQYEQPEALLRDADLAMYQAKALGRGRHAVFSESLHIEARQRLQLETDLHRALERQELRVYYQPIVSLESRRIIGAEALVRWQHPARGLVSPLDFIPLAEETGLIEPIGRWVLHQACAQADEWHRQGHTHLTVSVNVSVRELKMPNFVEVVAATLQQTALPPRFLILEMTESAYMEQASITGVVVERLRAMGVQIAFDDFGTGYSSLSYLRHFQVNRIKIDRSFIRDMTKNANDLAITGAMIAMAHQLNINVVAEGVETEEHLELLGAYRCDTVQGYLISRPVPNAAFLELLEQPAAGVGSWRRGAAPRGLTPRSSLAETAIGGVNGAPALVADAIVHDPLTGALSRVLFETCLREVLERMQRNSAACALCLFDIDHFKSINDTYGHPRGDQILRDLVQAIQQVLRSGDLLFRYGGDEFVLLLPHTTLDQALFVCQRIFDTLRVTHFCGTPPLKVAISMGVACFPDDADDGAQLLDVADRRNYLAKRQGRNRFVSADLSAAPAPSIDPQERLIEREDALATLHTFLHQLTQAGCGVLTVSSPPGSGHSRFLAYVHQVAQMLNYAALPLQPQPALQRRPFAVLAAARWPLPLPFLDGPTAVAHALQQGLEQEGRSGLLITIDDQHWLDRATLELLQQLLHGRALPRLALVVSSSQGKPDSRWSQLAPLQQTVVLPPFSETALRVWLRSRLHWEPPASFLSWLYQQTAGIPGQVQRLLDHLVEQSLLRPGEDRWVLHPDYPTARLASPGGAPAAPHNLPAHLTDFVGRARVCWAIDQLLETHRLVTLVGPGGSGKTRLALEIAQARQGLYPDGAWFVALDAIRTPELVAPTIAKALGISAPGDASLFECLKAFLSTRALLLALDNFEQVLAAAPLLTDLLVAAPHLQILVTSRERLHLVGECVFAVPPLDLPRLEEGIPLDVLAQNEAVTLFAHRATAARYDFALTEANARVVAELCIRLEGLPLAIELAAVRSDQFTPAELMEQLRHRLLVLTDGPRNLSDRQRALRSTIDWSYRLLPPVEQALFPCLGVFVDGFVLSMAKHICGDAPDPLRSAQDTAGEQVLEESLQSLVHKSLLHERERAGGRRFAMLETVREYALELLDRSPEARAIRQRHAACYLELVEQAALELTKPQQQRWLDRLEQENGNLRAALGWLLEQEAAEQALTFVTAVWKLWQFRGYHSEGRRWIERALAQARLFVASERYRAGGPAFQRAFDLARARALYALGWIARDQGDYTTVACAFEESLALSEAIGDQRGMGLALQGVGSVSTLRGDHQQAQRCFERSRALFTALDDREEVAWATEHLGQVASHLGDLEGAVRYHAESLAAFEEIGHTWGISIALIHLAEDLLDLGELERAKGLLEPWVTEQRSQHSAHRDMIFAHGLHLLGRAELYLGNLECAQTLLQTCIQLCTAAGYQPRMSAAYTDQGWLRLAQGEYAEARRAFRESLSLQQQLQEALLIQHALTGAAVLAAAQGLLDVAARLCAAADTLHEANQTLRAPLYQPEYQRLQDQIQTQLAPETVARLVAEGAAMTLDQAVEDALAYLNQSHRVAAVHHYTPAPVELPPCWSASA